MTINFPASPAGPGPNITLQIDAPDIEAGLEEAKAKVRKWIEEQARSLHDALPAPPVVSPPE